MVGCRTDTGQPPATSATNHTTRTPSGQAFLQRLNHVLACPLEWMETQTHTHAHTHTLTAMLTPTQTAEKNKSAHLLTRLTHNALITLFALGPTAKKEHISHQPHHTHTFFSGFHAILEPLLGLRCTPIPSRETKTHQPPTTTHTPSFQAFMQYLNHFLA